MLSAPLHLKCASSINRASYPLCDIRGRDMFDVLIEGSMQPADYNIKLLLKESYNYSHAHAAHLSFPMLITLSFVNSIIHASWGISAICKRL